MEGMTFARACRIVESISVILTRNERDALGRVTAEVALCREAQTILAECAHDLLVLLDETDPPVSHDERIGHAIDRLDQLVARVRLAPGGAGNAPAPETIRK